MHDNTTRTLDGSVLRNVCLVAPLGFLLSLQLIFPLERAGITTWKYAVCVCIVVTWSVAVGWRMLGPKRAVICRAYHSPCVTALIVQAVALCLTSQMLDGGLTLYPCLVAAMAHWMAASLVVARRPAVPGEFDLALVGYGFLPLYFAYTIMVLVWQVCYWEF